jgi:predicted phage terminase large subunit-like protein
VASKELMELRTDLWASFLLFTRTFFPLVTGRQFVISEPPGRESHYITIAKELSLVSRMQCPSLNINVPPGYGKSVLLCMWTAWTLSRWPNSQYLYISYGKVLATKHTEFIKRVISCSHYRDVFDVSIRHDSKAKDFFQTNHGGAIKSFGSTGAITGQDAGLPNVPHFSGAVIMDDMHKPDEVHSDTIRASVIQNYKETILQRPRAPNVPIIYLGQRLHEDDLTAYLMSGQDERTWKSVILKSIDDAGNALCPTINPLAQLREKQDKNPYVFASQYQQDPMPAGGALFKPENFVLMADEPKIIKTFITADTAETSKSYNDATVFGFFGLYEIEFNNQKTGQYGIHSLDCWEVRVEPKDLQDEFMSFYSDCMLHPVKPLVAAIEKKSTGVTLISTLKEVRGLEIRDVKRTKASGSKTERFLEMQPIIAAKLISFTHGAKHVDLCINHLIKITANDTHRHDDIADVFYDAIKIGLIDRTLLNQATGARDYEAVANSFGQRVQKIDRLKKAAYFKK